MFGSSSPPKDSDRSQSSAPAVAGSPNSPSSNSNNTAPESPDDADGDRRHSAMPALSPGSKKSPPDDDNKNNGGGGGRRRSSVAKAFATAKQSLHLTHSPATSTGSSAADSETTQHTSAFEKLGKTDPVLSVPQGSHNNSAGESRPGARSTFRVGVTEDKNKKCRRTMEDTHAYLYNFLSTPAPALGSAEAPTAPKGDASNHDAAAATPPTSAERETTSEVIETDNGYFAIFDGHAGTFAADWCGKKLHVLLEEIIRRNPNAAVPELLDQTFTSVDQQLQQLPLRNSGCTAICAVLRWEDRIPNPQSATGSTAIAPVAAAVARAHESPGEAGGLAPLLPPAVASTLPPSANAHGHANANAYAGSPHASAAAPGAGASSHAAAATALPKLQESATRQRVLYTANVGDARIVLCRSGKALRLSYDHKGSDENEGRRITSAGGLILNNRVNGVLAVTRALGDAYMKDLVTGHPYTTETVIQPDVDEFLILACDGVSPSHSPHIVHPSSNSHSRAPALGRLLRPRRRRPDPTDRRPASRQQTARRPRARPLLHGQPVVHGRALRRRCPAQTDRPALRAQRSRHARHPAQGGRRHGRRRRPAEPPRRRRE